MKITRLLSDNTDTNYDNDNIENTNNDDNNNNDNNDVDYDNNNNNKNDNDTIKITKMMIINTLKRLPSCFKKFSEYPPLLQ